MLVKEWARLEGLHPQTVWKWCRQGTMPVPVEQTPTGMWLIHDPKYETASQPNPAGHSHRLLRASIQRRTEGRFATSGRPVEGVRS